MSLLAPADSTRRREQGRTSAGGAMRGSPPTRYIIIISPFEFGTAARVIDEADWGKVDPRCESTTSGLTIPIPQAEDRLDPATAILEVRRRSGLTWDQLARLCKVDRRSLHFWASGKPPSPANEEQLRRVLNTIRAIDRGSANANRVILFEEREGRIPFDLLATGSYEEVAEWRAPTRFGYPEPRSPAVP